jgi:hypothetical protein
MYQSRTTKRTYVDGQHVDIQPGRYVKSDTCGPHLPKKLRVPIFGHDDIISDQRPTAAPINVQQRHNNITRPIPPIVHGAPGRPRLNQNRTDHLYQAFRHPSITEESWIDTTYAAVAIHAPLSEET